ncbi:hypothetical protein FRC03_009502 [Tulasnella sp. 419]|nr:hypothetical protein FRC03_009502 [Tulasnella sp. 419]
MQGQLTASQRDAVEILLSLGTGIEEDKAIELLKKYGWNIEQAASSMFAEPAGPQPTWDLPPDESSRAVVPISTSRLRASSPPPRARNRRDSPDARGAINSTQRTVPSQAKTTYIDLTNENNDADDEEEELRKAVAASLETEGQQLMTEIVYGPLNKGETDPVRPINQVGGNTAAFSQEDHNLNRALEASLATSLNADVYVDLPPEQRIRHEGLPVALRTADFRSICTVLFLQALFAVPQVREAFATWRANQSTPYQEFDGFLHHTDRQLVEFLQQIFAYMDLGQQSDLNIDGFLSNMNLPFTDPNDPGSNIRDFYDGRIALMCERAFGRAKGISDDVPLPSSARLFMSRGVSGSDADDWASMTGTSFIPDEATIVVNSSSDYDPNSLENALYTLLLKPPVASWFLATSAVLTFRVTRYDSPNTIPVKYSYPKRLYLDPFMAENRVAVKEKVDQRDAWSDEMEALARRRDTLTRNEGKDTLADLRKTIYFLENVADTKGDPQRRQHLDALASKLKEVILTIEKELKSCEEKLKELRLKSESVFNDPRWQQHAYDLRAVLVHDGIAGREHSYVYTQDTRSGKWLKTCDATITEVSEDDVLHDSTGLHLGAGPYILVYSRRIPDDYQLPSPLPWPRDICESIRDHDMKFKFNLPPDLAEKIVEPAVPEFDELSLLTVNNQQATQSSTKPSSPALQEPLPQQPAQTTSRELTISTSDSWNMDTGMQSRATTPSPVISSKGVSPSPTRGSPAPPKAPSIQAQNPQQEVHVETMIVTSPAPAGATGISRAKSDASRPRTSTTEAAQHSGPSRSQTMREKGSKESRGSSITVIASSRDKVKGPATDISGAGTKSSDRKKRDSNADKA